jgi:hypothetical protein
MTFLPIVTRELRVVARRRGTYWTRALTALFAILLGAWIFAAMSRAPSTAKGLFLFRGLAGLALAYCLGSGSRGTADCLSAEKRGGTLGLLFLTDLKGYDVVLGKLASNSLGGFYRLLAMFPVLAIPLLMGGISRGEFWRVVLVLVDTFLFAQAIGILASALSWEARAAMSLNTLLLLIPTALVPACALLAFWLSPLHPILNWPLLTSPICSLILSFDFAYRGPAADSVYFWVSLVLIHGMTWLCLLLTCRIVPHVWQDRPVRSEKPGWRLRWRYGNWPTRVVLRRRLLSINPFLWLVARDRRKPVRVWIMLGIFAGAWIGWLVWMSREGGSDVSWHDAPICLVSSVMVGGFLKLWLTIEVVERLAEERASGAMELLLSTPLTVHDILRGQRLALQKMFLRPAALVLAVEVVLLFASLGFADEGERQGLLIGWPVGFAMFVCDIAAIYWVGIYAALVTRNSNQAAYMVLLRLIFLPWVVFLGIITMLNLGPGPSLPLPWTVGLGLWFVAGLAVDVGFGLGARRELLSNFRGLAVKQFARKVASRAT